MKGANRIYPFMIEGQVKTSATQLKNKLKPDLSALLGITNSATYMNVVTYQKPGGRHVGCKNIDISSKQERRPGDKSEITRRLKAI